MLPYICLRVGLRNYLHSTLAKIHNCYNPLWIRGKTMLQLASPTPIINRRNVSMISLQRLRGMEVFPTISPPRAAVEPTAQWTFRSGSSCMVQREEKQTNLYPRLSRNGIPPRVLEHRGQSFPHDPVLWFLSFHSRLSNSRSSRKGSNVLRMLPSAGVYQEERRFFFLLGFQPNVACFWAGTFRMPGFTPSK